jgi:GTP-binding protein
LCAACSFWHAPARSKRGPDGGPGGRGGDVVLRADPTVRCLAHVSTSACGEPGSRGGAQGRAGKRGADCIVRVPVGTVVYERLGACKQLRAAALHDGSTLHACSCADVPGQSDDDDSDGDEDDDVRRARAQADGDAKQQRRGAPAAKHVVDADDAAVTAGGGYGRNYRPSLRRLADLSEPGATAVIARGGRGGRGNASLDDSKLGSHRDASEAGGEGGVVPLLLELKAVADVGLVGAPNVGKSTLLVRSVSCLCIRKACADAQPCA